MCQSCFNVRMNIWTAEKIILFSFLLRGVCCADWAVSLPENIEALSGSCVLIKCSFTIEQKYEKDLTERAVGVWLKDEHKKENTVFNSSRLSTNSIMKGNITGNLKEKNCTTIFYDIRSDHGGKYYFRIEGDGKLKWTYITPYVTVNVIESPHNPTVKLYKQMKVEGEEQVLENSSVSLHCSAKTLCSSPPPTLTWSSTLRPPLSESSRIQEEQNPPEIISDLNFTATHLHHRVTFTCTITYQLQDTNKTAHSNLTLHVQYSPKISLSSCNTTNVTVCFCEADGNPSPKLEWRLSGRPVTDSTNTSVSEKRLSSTGLRSSITLHHSLTHTLTLQCVSTNTHGNDTREFTLSPFTQETAGDDLFSLWIVLAVGVSVILCIVIFVCVRSSQRTQDNSTDLTDRKNEEEFVYANKAMSPEALHYSSIDFTNTKPESEEIRGISSLTTDYSVIRHHSDPQTHSNISAAVIKSQKDQHLPDREAKIREESFQPSEDSTYQNISHSKIVPSATIKQQHIMSEDEVTKQVMSKKTELLTQSDEVPDLYAQVKHQHPKK